MGPPRTSLRLVEVRTAEGRTAESVAELGEPRLLESLTGGSDHILAKDTFSNDSIAELIRSADVRPTGLSLLVMNAGPDIFIEKPRWEINPEYRDFQKVRVTKVDETKPWKPPVEVEVTKTDGSLATISADTPFFTFRTPEGQTLTVSAAAAGHIDALHIKGTEPGSRFDYSSLEALLQDAVAKLPTGTATTPGVSAFSIPMGRTMGKEGVATVAELREAGVLRDADVQAASQVRQRVMLMNKNGTLEEKQRFIRSFQELYPDSKIQFQLVRGTVVVPVVDAPKVETQNLFMVFGPDGHGGKTLWTAAPGRFMPKHPDPAQHQDASGKLDEASFWQSADAWFDTVMLTGQEPVVLYPVVEAIPSRSKTIVMGVTSGEHSGLIELSNRKNSFWQIAGVSKDGGSLNVRDRYGDGIRTLFQPEGLARSFRVGQWVNSDLLPPGFSWFAAKTGEARGVVEVADRTQSPWQIDAIVRGGTDLVVTNAITGEMKTLHCEHEGAFDSLRPGWWVKSELL